MSSDEEVEADDYCSIEDDISDSGTTVSDSVVSKQDSKDINDFRTATQKKLTSKYGETGDRMEFDIYTKAVKRCEYLQLNVTIKSDKFREIYDEISYNTIVRSDSSILWDSSKFANLGADRKMEETDATQDVEEGVHECGKCHSKKTKSITMQTRSSDEGSTIFVFCSSKKCNNVWKIYN